ncbi:hypothetical protein [Prosthecomicrobium sp. N25]|uniref:hypothetical protein n=1 Tax=Prosthecomicrobium sp. N25 TaxID=3129254 RepID=UPI0030769FD0
MGEIRACTAEDIPAVAALFQKTFVDARRPVPAGLADCIRGLLFGHPDFDPEIASRVLVEDGRVVGFAGVVPLRMWFRGRRLRAAVPTSLSVEDPQRRPLAGAKLVRAFLQGPQDLSISEPTNVQAQKLWVALGGETVTAESMEWLKVLKPAGLAVALAADALPAARFARPAARLVDRFAGRFVGAVPARPAGLAVEATDDGGFATAVADAMETYALRPDWPSDSFAWQLSHAAGNRSRGPLRRLVMRDGKGRVAGAALYQGAPGGVGWVLQLLARPEAARAVLAALMADAAAAGCVAVKGRTQARLLDGLLDAGALLFRRHTSMVHARDPEIAAAVRAGEAITSGFAGEAWMRHVSDRWA